MIDAIAGIGPGFKGPSPHVFRGSLLKDVVQDVRIYLSGIKVEWGLYGCSVMSDGWKNQKQQPIINFLVFSPKGTIFLNPLIHLALEKTKKHCWKFLIKLFKKLEHKILFSLSLIMMQVIKLRASCYNRGMALSFGLHVLPIVLT